LRFSYAELRGLVEQTADQLRALGLKAGDRVALVALNGPEFLAGYLGACAVGAAVHPLNAQLTPTEVDFAVDDADIALTIVVAGCEATLVGTRVSRDRTALLRLDAGRVVIEGTPLGPHAEGSAVEPDADALLLFTSGTTSRPKLVPLTHANLLRSARNVAASYQLTEDDISLCVMPLFHVHGLVASTMATLLTGGTVIAPPRFSASAFWQQARESGATWYSAVPTIHTILLAGAGDEMRGAGKQFRFVRSCSSALAAAMQERYESLFEVPVLQAYGMTEAAHQIATNPLPPSARKHGSVGVPYGVEVTVLDDDGNQLPRGATGEVSIRGANVTRGYLHNPEANAASFTGGWFRTGDSGYIDAEGYVFLEGRIKELINRGGEKISPHEVDAALLAHPAVQEAVAIAVPHDVYGEEVEAVVALKPGASLEADELIAFAGERLAKFKVPKAIRFVPEVPRSATGKIQRRRLLELLDS
jgi:acyl-CoA synthetase (AMP-forming)/AMP-acid ligase II